MGMMERENQESSEGLSVDSAFNREIMTVEEVARFLRKSESWIYKHWKDLGGARLGGSLFFPSREDLYERIFHQGEGLLAIRVHENGKRYTGAGFKTRRDALREEARRKEEVENGVVREPQQKISGGMDFSELVVMRLDFIKVYKTAAYYKDNRLLFRRLLKLWGTKKVDEISSKVIEGYILERAKDSHHAANYDLRLLKALFNHGIKHGVLKENPVNKVPFLPVEKKRKYVPSSEDIDKVISAAVGDDQDYLWTIRETLGRMSEINRLTWEDVDLERRYVTLYTRKKKGGSLTPREVPMTEKLFEVLSGRRETRDPNKPWVFWHRYRSGKTGEMVEGPYGDRKNLMKSLCRKTGVKYFRFHALRHAGASIMDNANVPTGDIQRILGHEYRTTTDIYLHGLGGTERIAMAVYERARQKSHTESHTSLNIDLSPRNHISNSLYLKEKVEPAMGFEPAAC